MRAAQYCNCTTPDGNTYDARLDCHKKVLGQNLDIVVDILPCLAKAEVDFAVVADG